MTPGEEALREAMRLEQARIYSATCREQPRLTAAERTQRDEERAIRSLRRQGQSLAKIALRVGVSKTHVTDVLRRAS